MERIKGQIVDILGTDCVLLEIQFIGNYNKSGFSDTVKVHFTELVPPFLKDAGTHKMMDILQKKILGETASLQVQRRISDEEVIGRIQLEGAKFRGKRRRV